MHRKRAVNIIQINIIKDTNKNISNSKDTLYRPLIFSGSLFCFV